ncbi:LysR substrate-binding domain-containing protein [Burkholderia multivorans]|nr:LysR substrate-binding domain-containing protein [Burkholderia multivorans]
MRARLAQAQLTLARQDIRQILGGKRGRVSAAVTPMIFLGVLPNVIERFRTRMPPAELTLDEGMMPLVLPALRDGAIDFAVAAPTVDALGNEFEFEALGTLDTVVVCRRGHPLEHATEWNQLVDCTWVMNLSPGSQHSGLLDHFHRQRLPIPTRIIRTNTFGVCWNLMARSDALLACPAGMLAVEPYAQQASRIPLHMALPALELGILKMRDMPLSLAAETLAEMFKVEIDASTRSARGVVRPVARRTSARSGRPRTQSNAGVA